MALTLKVPPAVEPVTRDQLKQHLRLTTNQEDTYLDFLLRVARQKAERETGRSLITQQWRYTRDKFPNRRVIFLERPPLQSVEAFQFRNVQEVEQDVTAGWYMTDLERSPGRIVLLFQYIWPITSFNPSAVWVDYTAGYGDQPESVPEDFKMAILFMAAHWFNNREPVQDGKFADVPKTVDYLLAPFKVWVPHD